MDQYRFSGRMARAARRGLFLLTAGTIAGCDGDLPPVCGIADRTVECPECSDMPVPNAPKKRVPVACSRWIAIGSGGVCPSYPENDPAPSWVGTPLFPELSTGSLGSYCSYEWKGDTTTGPDESLLPLPNHADCTFVAPQSSDAIAHWAYWQFLDAVNGPLTNGVRPRAQAGPAEGDGEAQMHTRVVVLDTSPDSDPAVRIEPGAASRHGETLAYLIRDIACADPASCSVDVKTQLVMPWLWHQGVATPEPEGGNVGLLGDVVQALGAEILAYREDLSAAAAAWLNAQDDGPARRLPSRLIFNESFAYEDASGTRCADVEPSETETDAKALFDILQAAACLGALHVAAAGNHTGGTAPSEGLMCPARWHALIEPSEDACKTLLGPTVFQEIKDNFQAVTLAKYGAAHELFVAEMGSTDALVSVGGVDYEGTPIVMTRPDACPELVALGLGGIGWDAAHTVDPHQPPPDGSPPDPAIPPALFGTSVSAAVVSGRLAAEWSKGGVPVAGASTLVFKAEGETRRLSTGGACTHLTGPLCLDTTWWIAPSFETASTRQNPAFPGLGSVLVARHPEENYTITQESAPVCSPSIPQCRSQSAAAASWASAYVWAQPTDPLCLKCGVYVGPPGLPSEFWLDPSGKFGPDLEAHQTPITGAVLVVEDITGAVILTQDLPIHAVTRRSSVMLDIPGFSFEGTRVWLSVYDTHGLSVSQQIFVHP